MEDDMEEEESEEEENQMRHIQICLKKNLKLILTYKPDEIEDPRNFDLQFKLAGIGVLDELTRNVRGVGVNPRFFILPTELNFGKKVIAKSSKPMPHSQDLKIQS